jgi:type VI secretion system secreted protein VgrG
MAKLVKTTIHINGVEVKQFHQFSLNQGIFAHHTFKLVCPAEVLDDIKSTPLSKSKNLIGTSFKVKIENFDGKDTPLQFLGLVTQVEAAKYNGHSGDAIISGYSPTILMDNSPHCKSWQDQTINSIATEVFNVFSKNLLAPNLQAAYNTKIPYTVQYKETAWQFMNRLAATYGEWLFYTGEKVCLGPLQPKTAQLTYGSNLSHLSVALQLRPGNFAQVAYDYNNTTTHESSPRGIAQRAGLNSLGNHSYNKSNEFFDVASKVYNASFVDNPDQLNEMTNTRAAAQASNLVRFNGASTHFGVQLGNAVGVDNNHGSYTIVEVTHSCNGIGNYSNEFIAIPETIKVPPATNYSEPYCETQSAIVLENFDEQGLGRIRVQFKWMNQSEKTPWIRMMMPHAGGGKGAFFIPEKGEEVMVAFENNNPTKPYVQGAMYNSSQNNGFSNKNNDIKIIQTRSGHIIELNDAGEGTSITIKDIGGNSIFLDTIGKNITVTAPETMTFNAKNMVVNVEENLTTTVGKDMKTTVGANHKMLISENYIIKSKTTNEKVLENKQSTIVGDLKVKTATTEIISLDGDILLHSAGIATMYGDVDAKVNKG